MSNQTAEPLAVVKQLYVLNMHNSITRANVDIYQLERETAACWIVRQYGAERRLLKTAYRGFTDRDELKAFVREQVAKETIAAQRLVLTLEAFKGVTSRAVQADSPTPLTDEERARMFDD